ncbi:hypothetical protein PAHAL_1G399500 [Panicum hallii]|uniref:Uncharacterized protein n=1 Tax=Panicum hallii TaxID=206008 RepID=A0A2T8KXU8_9POAL|nr:hypothetical protein PAHAL_1G399500 [Panicum hallii]
MIGRGTRSSVGFRTKRAPGSRPPLVSGSPLVHSSVRAPGLSPATHHPRPNHSPPIRPITDATPNCLIMFSRSDRVHRVECGCVHVNMYYILKEK